MFLLPITLTVLQPEGIFPFIAGYLFSTFYLSPDLDLPQSNPSQRWGVLKILWVPYQMLFSHRSFFSHFPVISSILRLVYIFLPIFILTFIIFKIVDEIFFESAITMLLQKEIVANNIEIESYIKYTFIYFSYGVIMADLFHIVLDITVSSLNSFRKKLNQKVKFLKI